MFPESFRTYIAHDGIEDTVKEITQVVWNTQRGRAKQLVDKFKNPQDPQAKIVINKGIVRLVGDIFLSKAEIYNIKVRGEIEWDEIKSALIEIFDSNLPEEIPEDIKLGHGGNTLTRNPDNNNRRIMPRHIELIIKRYGLDGTQRALKELVREEREISRSGIAESLEGTMYKLFRNPTLKDMVIEKGPSV